MEIFKTKKTGKKIHMVDDRGNHFIGDDLNGPMKCVNPLSFESGVIGSTIPKKEDRIPIKIEITKRGE